MQDFLHHVNCVNDAPCYGVFGLIGCIVVHSPAGHCVRSARPIGINLVDLFRLLSRHLLAILSSSVLLSDCGILSLYFAVGFQRSAALVCFIVVLDVFLY